MARCISTGDLSIACRNPKAKNKLDLFDLPASPGFIHSQLSIVGAIHVDSAWAEAACYGYTNGGALTRFFPGSSTITMARRLARVIAL